MQELPKNFEGKYEVDAVTGCWNWIAAKTHRGYGKVRVGNRLCRAHRIAYEALVGPIPEGLTIDHLCRNPSCIRPDHLEPVSQAENCRRGLTGLATAAMQRSKSHCPQGHAYEGDNLTVRKDGSRACRACVKDRMRVHYHKRKAGLVGTPNGEKTHCKRGHEYTDENTMQVPGGRSCRECSRLRSREYHKRSGRRSD